MARRIRESGREIKDAFGPLTSSRRERLPFSQSFLRRKNKGNFRCNLSLLIISFLVSDFLVLLLFIITHLEKIKMKK